MRGDPTGATWAEAKAAYWAAYWRSHQRVLDQADSRLARTAGDRSDQVTDEDFWVWDYVDAIWRRGDQAALDQLVDLADSASNDEQLGYLGAGPVEDLVRVFGESLIDDIEAAARRSPAFLRALQGMYGILIPESIRVRMLPWVPVTVDENRIRLEDRKEAL
jgi:hypothetical protein